MRRETANRTKLSVQALESRMMMAGSGAIPRGHGPRPEQRHVHCFQRTKAFEKGNAIMTLLASIALVLSLHTLAQAKKPASPPGGDGGGGSDFQLVELQPAGSSESSAYAISDSGIVVGAVDGTPGIWDSSETVPAFIPLAGGYGEALSINGFDEIVGWGLNGPRYWANVIANPVNLPLPAGFDAGTANGISSNGIVVGEIWGPASEYEIMAAAWRVTEGLVFGPILLDAGGAHDVASMGAGINRAVGRSADAEFGHVATAWDLLTEDDGTFTVIGSTLLVAGVAAETYAITNTGDVTGSIKEWVKGEWVHTAFVIRDGAFVRLPSGRRNKFGVGYDLNAMEVVGQSGKVWYSDNLGATQWNLQNKRQDLVGSYFDASWSHTAAEGLNASGEVVGSGSGGAWLLRH